MVEAIRNLINQSDKILFDVKNKLKEEKDKTLLKVKEQIPTPEEITSRIKSEVCSIEASNNVDKNYNNIKGKLNFLKDKLEQGIKKLETLNKKTEKIKEWMDKIKKILEDILTPIITILNKIVQVLPISLNVLSGLLANGFAIKKFSDLIDLAKSKIVIIKATIKTFQSSVIKFLAKLTSVFTIIAAAIAALQIVINTLGALMAILEQLYLFYLAQCNLPSNPVNPDGSLNNEVLDLVIDGLTQNGNNEIIEKIYNANFETIGYRRYKT
jgi:archaellum component FlaC